MGKMKQLAIELAEATGDDPWMIFISLTYEQRSLLLEAIREFVARRGGYGESPSEGRNIGLELYVNERYDYCSDSEKARHMVRVYERCQKMRDIDQIVNDADWAEPVGAKPA